MAIHILIFATRRDVSTYRFLDIVRQRIRHRAHKALDICIKQLLCLFPRDPVRNSWAMIVSLARVTPSDRQCALSRPADTVDGRRRRVVAIPVVDIAFNRLNEVRAIWAYVTG